MNHTYDVIMHELQKDGSVHELRQTAICPSRDDVIRIYGLDQPDIVSYEITERK